MTAAFAAPGEYELFATPGAWSGDVPLTFAYRWQSCSVGAADGDACADLDGLTTQTVVVTPAVAVTAYRVVVTAANAEGSASSASKVFTLRATGIAPALPPRVAGLRLVALQPPKKATRGRPLTVRARVVRADTGQPLTTASVSCQVLVGGAVVRPTLVGWRAGTAVCSWTVPRRLRPVRIALTLSVRAGGLTGSRVFVVRLG